MFPDGDIILLRGLCVEKLLEFRVVLAQGSIGRQGVLGVFAGSLLLVRERELRINGFFKIGCVRIFRVLGKGQPVALCITGILRVKKRFRSGRILCRFRSFGGNIGTLFRKGCFAENVCLLRRRGVVLRRLPVEKTAPVCACGAVFAIVLRQETGPGSLVGIFLHGGLL